MPDRPFLSPSQKNGLERDSYLEIDKVSAIDRDCIAQRVGRISDDDIKIVNSEMAKMLPLGER
jgi:mRNA-degrading endonuclease toxin of MazEF toxin-antitoxin module